MKNGLEEHLGMLGHVVGDSRVVMQADPRGLSSLPTNLEARLPHLDQALKVTHAEWLPVTNTRFIHAKIQTFFFFYIYIYIYMT